MHRLYQHFARRPLLRAMAAAASPSNGASEAGFAAIQAEKKAKDVNLAQQLSGEYAGMLAGMREVFESGRTKDVEWRKRQLEGLIKGIQANTTEIAAAVQADLGGSKMRNLYDMMPTIGDAEYALANLNTWAAPKKMNNDIPIDFQSSCIVKAQPKGVTLIIAPWNFPFSLSFQPMVSALAAGNCLVLKPSEMSANCAVVIEKIVKEHLDPDAVKVVQGAVTETSALLEQQWDHIFYTGNGVVGRIVMQAAAKHLTPITLELGGKSPVLVDKTANMDTVVNRVFAAKNMNQGQVCIAPDYVVIDESRADEFIDKFVKQIHASNFGAGSKSNPDWGTIITPGHANRLKRLIDTSGGEVMCGGSADIDAAARHVPMTVIKGVSLDAPVMQEEVFGPVLPVITVKNIDDGIKLIKEREPAMALYVFSQDKNFQERALSECPSGGAAVNTAVEQVANKEAPFGGFGASGMGQYHGKPGFDEFSHFKTVLYKTGSAPLLPPPEKQPAWLYDVALKAMVIGFVSPETKQKVKMAGYGALALGAGVILRSRL